ncbi:internal scaffolding protein [Dipodfec virus UOA04_Rod_753]|nr:internal scaffolding protein [Dipodfec virus UOA04_Rod_753]
MTTNSKENSKIDSSLNDSGNAVIGELKPTAVSKKPYKTSLDLPPKIKYHSDMESMVFESPNEIKSPQEIMDLYGMYSRDTSMFPNNELVPQYGDFASFKNFEDRANLVADCRQQFDALPSEIRAKFDYDIYKFAEHVNSSDFDYESIMTEGYKQKVWNPMKEHLETEAKMKGEEADYKKYLYDKAKEEIALAKQRKNPTS